MGVPCSSPAITPFLWFDDCAEEAVAWYCAIFPNARRLSELRNSGDAPGPRGGVIVIDFELSGQRMSALNGGPGHPFTQAISLVVTCNSQQEIDHYWTQLTAGGGREIQCGWLVDKFGLSWQVVPAGLRELLRHPAAMRAMLGMVKLDLAALQNAAGASGGGPGVSSGGSDR